MKKRVVDTTWAALLALLLTLALLAACGPAVSVEDATRAAAGEPSVADEEATNEAIAATAAVAPEEEIALDEFPTPMPIPTVTGEEVETDSGLIYIETQAGDGRTPEAGDIVTMNIVGYLEDGTIFADTAAEGTPITATATEGDLFAGWLEGLLLMQEGGKARLIIPPDLAFGEEGAGGVIPPTRR